MTISLFITCYNDTLFPETGKAVVAVLERLGHTVEFRAAQTCCGQLHYNAGYRHEGISIMRHFVSLFRDADLICIPSASCVAMIRESYPKIASALADPELEAHINQLLPRVFEFSELIVEKLGLEDVGAYYPHTVTYHPSCHSLRSLRTGDKPICLLRKVRGLTFIDLPDQDECCGFGGTFAVKNPDVSAAMLSDKVRGVLDTGAEVCCSADNSCLMHIYGALHRQRTGVRTAHLAEILASTEPGERI